MQKIKSPEGRTTVTATEARGGQIVKGGATLRILVISLGIVVGALLVTYLIYSYGY